MTSMPVWRWGLAPNTHRTTKLKVDVKVNDSDEDLTEDANEKIPVTDGQTGKRNVKLSFIGIEMVIDSL